LVRRELAEMNYEPLANGRADIAPHRLASLLLTLKLYQIYDRLPEPWRLAYRKMRARVFGVGSF
jgi:hypothetical protein